jgi:hypothetical protein
LRARFDFLERVALAFDVWRPSGCGAVV